MKIYQVYYNNGEEFPEDRILYNVICGDLATAMNYRPPVERDELESLFALELSSDGYFNVVQEWYWEDNCWEFWYRGA